MNDFLSSEIVALSPLIIIAFMGGTLVGLAWGQDESAETGRLKRTIAGLRGYVGRVNKTLKQWKSVAWRGRKNG